jgi:hypothetical protein
MKVNVSALTVGIGPRLAAALALVAAIWFLAAWALG